MMKGLFTVGLCFELLLELTNLDQALYKNTANAHSLFAQLTQRMFLLSSKHSLCENPTFSIL